MAVAKLPVGTYATTDSAALELTHARFFNEVEAGVLYVNRRAGATSGAWPGIRRGVRRAKKTWCSVYKLSGNFAPGNMR